MMYCDIIDSDNDSTIHSGSLYDDDIMIMVMMMMMLILLPSTVLSSGGQGIYFFKNAAAEGINKVAVGFSPTPS
jgi:hypothetical protein